MDHDNGSTAGSSDDPEYFPEAYPDQAQGVALAAVTTLIRQHWRAIAAATLVGGAAGYGISFLATPLYKSHTTLIPPQAQQSTAASALASLGAIGSLAAGGIKSPVEQYISLMQSEAVTDKLINRFDLMKVYDSKFRDATRKMLLTRTLILAGKKDGLITVEVEDSDPKRAAAMATQFVEELRHVTATLAVTEAQQRRLFFENQMLETKAKLTEAQIALQQSGFNQGALNAEPQSAAAGYARLRTELAAAQVRLATLENSLASTAPEVRQQSATVSALQDQLRQLESSAVAGANSPDYVSKYRTFKYEETLFELMAKQYEIARVDESREGALIQVVDPAREAERRSWPRRSLFLAGGAVAGLLLAALYVILRPRQPAARAD
jgi:uncharacterized protein involved in exopolysaccharide biosynthesis